MGNLREEIPGEFSDDERWYRFFTRKSILALLIMGVISLIIIKFSDFLGFSIIGIYLSLILTGIVMLVVMLPIPQGDVLHGSGCSLDIILLRMYARKKNAKIYVRGYQMERKSDGIYK